MKKRIRLTESDLVRLVKRVIKEQGDLNVVFDPENIKPPTPEDLGKQISQEERIKSRILVLKDGFEKIQRELIAIKKPSKINDSALYGEISLDYTDTVYVQGKGAIRTYSYSITNLGYCGISTNSPEIKKIAQEAGFPYLEKFSGEESFGFFWYEGDFNDNIQKMKKLLSNPKLRVSYDYKF
jgi:signal peptidase I